MSTAVSCYHVVFPLYPSCFLYCKAIIIIIIIIIYFLKRFSRTHSEIFCKYKYDVSKHIQEGVCLPVTVRVDLAKNITTRSR